MHADVPKQKYEMTKPGLHLVDDDLLVEHSRTDVDAFEAIYSRYSGPVYRMCLRATGDPDIADRSEGSIRVSTPRGLPGQETRVGIITMVLRSGDDPLNYLEIYIRTSGWIMVCEWRRRESEYPTRIN